VIKLRPIHSDVVQLLHSNLSPLFINLISCLFAQLKKVKGRCTETPGETTFGLLFPIFGKLTVGVQIWWGSEILRRNLLLWGIHKKGLSLISSHLMMISMETGTNILTMLRRMGILVGIICLISLWNGISCIFYATISAHALDFFFRGCKTLWDVWSLVHIIQNFDAKGGRQVAKYVHHHVL
jgi:hypothetical protein